MVAQSLSSRIWLSFSNIGRNLTCKFPSNSHAFFKILIGYIMTQRVKGRITFSQKENKTTNSIYSTHQQLKVFDNGGGLL